MSGDKQLIWSPCTCFPECLWINKNPQAIRAGFEPTTLVMLSKLLLQVCVLSLKSDLLDADWLLQKVYYPGPTHCNIHYSALWYKIVIYILIWVMPQSHFHRAPGGEGVTDGHPMSRPSETNPGCLKLHLVTVTSDTGAARQQTRFPPIKSNGQRTGTVGWPYGHRPGTIRRPWGTRPMFSARAEPARWTGGGRTYPARCPGPLRFICDELGRKKVCRPSENYNSALKVGGGPCGVF